jgi:hypothetical protein
MATDTITQYGISAAEVLEASFNFGIDEQELAMGKHAAFILGKHLSAFLDWIACPAVGARASSRRRY